MNWELAITQNRDALLRVIGVLFASIGLTPGGSVATLPRYLHSAALFILRPAESALRRLVIAEARELAVPEYVPSKTLTKAIVRGDGAARVPCFRLFDPMKRFDLGGMRRAACPRFSVPGYDVDPVFPEVHEPLPDDAMDARRLCRRLQAVKHALETLPQQAKRMARAEARRLAAPPGPKRAGPLRPGWPPGHRTRQKHPVDYILMECDALARNAMRPRRGLRGDGRQPE